MSKTTKSELEAEVARLKAICSFNGIAADGVSAATILAAIKECPKSSRVDIARKLGVKAARVHAVERKAKAKLRGENREQERRAAISAKAKGVTLQSSVAEVVRMGLLSYRASQALVPAFATLADVVAASDVTLLRLEPMGRRTLNEVRELLSVVGERGTCKSA